MLGIDIGTLGLCSDPRLFPHYVNASIAEGLIKSPEYSGLFWAYIISWLMLDA